MQVILQKNVTHVGFVGDVVDVKPGYYRNYLGPRQLALLANPKSIKQAEHQKKVIQAKKAKEKSAAEEIKIKIEAHAIEIKHSAGAGDKLFGSITAQEIAVALRKDGFEIDRKQLKLEAPLKTLGSHTLEVRLHPEVVAMLKVDVQKKED